MLVQWVMHLEYQVLYEGVIVQQEENKEVLECLSMLTTSWDVGLAQ